MNKRELEILKIGFEAGKKAIEMHPDDDEYDTIRLEEAQEQVKNLDISLVSKSCDSCKNLSTCRFWAEAPENGATCKFYIEHVC